MFVPSDILYERVIQCLDNPRTI